MVESLRILQKLHRNRNYRPAAETLDMLLKETRANLAIALRPSGEQVLANVLHIAELARKYEASGGLSFRGFVEEVRSGADGVETGEAPIFEEGSEGVRMMSVHKAKGLEFPVVILADITAKICQSHPSRYIDASSSLCAVPLAGCSSLDLQERGDLELARDRTEGIRLAYVAATRARELLVFQPSVTIPASHGTRSRTGGSDRSTTPFIPKQNIARKLESLRHVPSLGRTAY